MNEKVIRLGIKRNNERYLYYIKNGDVWAVPREPKGAPKAVSEIVAKGGIEMDPDFIYYLDSDGDISRTKRVTDNNCVQYIVVRKDLVPQMGVGKTAAQVAHGSLAVLLVHLPNGGVELSKAQATCEWLTGRFTKLVVYVKTKQKLLNLAEKLNGLGIAHRTIYDKCLTRISPEEKNGTTLTCMGVIPLWRDDVPKCLKTLQLLGDDDE